MRNTEKRKQAEFTAKTTRHRAVGDFAYRSMSYEQLYAQLVMWGYHWSSHSKKWIEQTAPSGARTDGLTRFPAHIRVMCDEIGDAELAAS